MGIQGLTSFIDDNLHLLKDFQLHDSKVVIDGNNLFHLLFYSYNVDFTHGGDYVKFASKIKEFFDILHSCKIEPYIILDGGYEPDDRKFKTVLERATTRIHLAEYISNGQRGKILPILSYEVFITSLKRLGIPHVTCDFEADNQIAVLANDLKCPVISFDSDFYILNLVNGFIPFDSVNFEVQPVDTDKDGNQYKYMPVKIYFTQNFVDCFPELDRQVLPLMATVLGNDYVSIRTFEEFYSALKVPKHGSSTFAVSKTHTKMLKIINWLENLKSVESGIDKLVMSSKPENRENVKRLVNNSMKAFSDNTSYSSFNLYEFFNDPKSPLKETETKTYNENSIPTWFSDFHRHGKLHVIMQNTLVLHRNILQCQVEHIKSPSSHSCSLYLRQLLYSVLLRDETTEKSDKDATKEWCVEEYDRQDGLKNLKKNLVQPLQIFEGFGSIPGLKDIELISGNRRREFLYKAFHVEFERNSVFSDDIKLFVMAVIFWIRNANPQIDILMLKTIILCWIAISARNYCDDLDGEESVINTTLDKSSSQQRQRLRNNMEKFFKVPQHSRKYPIDIIVIHAFCQFQSCFLSTLHLNQILQFPLPPVNPACIFNGSFLYSFYKDLKTRTNPDLFISEMLVKQSPLLLLFQNMIVEIMTHVDDGCFQTQVSSFKRTRNRKKHKSEKSASAESEELMTEKKSTSPTKKVKPNTNVVAECELTNRFDFLDIEDSDELEDCI